MKSIVTILVLLFASQSFAQVRAYYRNNDFPAVSASSIDKTATQEITGVSFHYVVENLHVYFTNSLKLERIGFLPTSINDSVLLITERYKNRNDPDINPRFEFLELKFRVQKSKFDTIIERLDFTGSEAMLGEFYTKYWHVELNLIDLKNPEIISETKFANDLIQLKVLPTKKEESTISYCISVSSQENNMVAVISNTKSFLAQKSVRKRDFDLLRNTKQYPLQTSDLGYYNQKKQEIEDALKSVIGLERNITGNCLVSVSCDTNGVVWISVNGKNAPLNNRLRQKLNSLNYKNHMLYGYKMMTEDSFSFDYSFVRETVDLMKNPTRIKTISTNVPAVEAIAKREATGFWMEKADISYDVSILDINGSKQEVVFPTKAVKRTTAAKAIGGFFAGTLLFILTVIGDLETE